MLKDIKKIYLDLRSKKKQNIKGLYLLEITLLIERKEPNLKILEKAQLFMIMY